MPDIYKYFQATPTGSDSAKSYRTKTGTAADIEEVNTPELTGIDKSKLPVGVGSALEMGKLTPVSLPGGGIVSSSIGFRNDIAKLSDNITTLSQDFNIEKPEDDFDKQLGEMTADIDKRQADIKTRKEEDITQIGKGFDVAKEELETKQQEALDVAEGRTRIGGFLTQMEVKDILNMRRQHRLEVSALEVKRQELVRDAQRAYEDDDYKLAREKVTEAKDLKDKIRQDKKDFMDSVLRMSSETRTATEFTRKQAQSEIDKISEGIKNGSININELNPATKNKLLQDAGYDFDIFAATDKLAQQGEVIGSPNINNKTGEVHVLVKKKDGTYDYKKVGKVTPSTPTTEWESKAELNKKKASALAEAQTLFTRSQDQKGLRGSDGKVAPDDYRATMQIFAEKYSMTPMEFIKEFPPERYISAGELKNNPDLTSSKAGGGESASPAVIESYAKKWADSSLTNPLAIPADIRNEVFLRADEIKKEQEGEEE